MGALINQCLSDFVSSVIELDISYELLKYLFRQVSDAADREVVVVARCVGMFFKYEYGLSFNMKSLSYWS